MANRSCAPARVAVARAGGLLGGGAPWVRGTRWWPSRSAAARAQRRWAKWIGLKLPPKHNRRMLDGSLAGEREEIGVFTGRISGMNLMRLESSHWMMLDRV